MLGRTHRNLGVIGLLACCAVPHAGSAAEQVIEDILVTGTKRSVAISDIAGSISALGADAIEERSINNIEDIQGMVPNLNFRDQLGYRLISIRGIGGTINFISKAPTDEFEGRVSVGAGSFGEGRASAMLLSNRFFEFDLSRWSRWLRCRYGRTQSVNQLLQSRKALGYADDLCANLCLAAEVECR